MDFCKKFLLKKFCYKILPLFGASDVDELIEILEKNKADSSMNYQNAFDSCPSIIDYIPKEKIALY